MAAFGFDRITATPAKNPAQSPGCVRRLLIGHFGAQQRPSHGNEDDHGRPFQDNHEAGKYRGDPERNTPARPDRVADGYAHRQRPSRAIAPVRARAAIATQTGRA